MKLQHDRDERGMDDLTHAHRSSMPASRTARCQPINVAGLTMTNALRQSKKRASLDNTNRSAAVVGAAFFSRSWNKASCLRKNRFSAASAVRLRKPVPQKLMQSETTICNVTFSFESCRKMLSTWQSSHAYPLIRLPDHVFADHRDAIFVRAEVKR